MSQQTVDRGAPLALPVQIGMCAIIAKHWQRQWYPTHGSAASSTTAEPSVWGLIGDGEIV